MLSLNSFEKEALIARYGGKFPVEPVGYGTVRDYCDSCDHLPWLSTLQHDLKDLQRPWTVKAALGLLPRGSRLLEIGAGQPVVAATLAELGYSVTVIDPYDGSGRGPTQFEDFVQAYPKVRIIRSQFQPDVPQLKHQKFDAIYSISVLEHVPEPGLRALFLGISAHLESHGRSFHSVDCVTAGNGAEHHFEQCLRIVNYQREIAGGSSMERKALLELFERADEDIETCYLSAAGHNLWRSKTPYEMFPFRKVLSFQTTARLRRGKHWAGYMRTSAICSAPLHESSVACQVEAVSSIPKPNPWNSDEPFSYKQMWFGATVCQERINRKIAGENIHWLEYVWKKYMAPRVAISAGAAALRCLILGSSEGWIELHLCEKGFSGEIVASDIAEKAVSRARAKVADAGYHNVRHVIADLNSDSFEGEFDFIIAEGVLHHIMNMERCLGMLRSCLKDGGLIFAVEFEGAFRFQLQELQVRWINAALRVLPKALRPFPPGPGEDGPASEEENRTIFYLPAPEEAVASFDPTEAHSGRDLKRLIPQIFETVERTGYGGTLLSYMASHFDFERSNRDPFARTWLEVLCHIEDAVIASGILEDEFIFYVLQKKSVNQACKRSRDRVSVSDTLVTDADLKVPGEA